MNPLAFCVCWLVIVLCLTAQLASAQVRHVFIEAEITSFAQTRTVAVPLEHAEPFLALGAQWSAASKTQLQIRVSPDGFT